MTKIDVLRILFDLSATQWQLAEAIGISEPTLTRWLRHPLEGERLERVKRCLEVLQEEAGGNA